MRIRSSLAAAWLSIALVAAACGSEDDKQVARGADAGAAGDAGADPGPTTGGSASLGGGGPDGGVTSAGGARPEPVGDAGAGAGAAAGGSAGAGGDSGYPPLTLASLAGDWSVRKLDTYFCETSVSEPGLVIDGDSITLSGFPYSGVDASGTISQGANGFTFDLSRPQEESPPVVTRGQLFVEPSGQYALLVAGDEDEYRTDGYVAVLARAEAAPLQLTDADVAGTWAGPSLRLDGDFEITEVLTSSATFAIADEAITLEGEDADGPLSGEDQWYTDQEASFVVAPITQGEVVYGGAFLASPDKRVLMATLFAKLSDEQYYNELCDQRIFTSIASHKFGLWTKQD